MTVPSLTERLSKYETATLHESAPAWCCPHRYAGSPTASVSLVGR